MLEAKNHHAQYGVYHSVPGLKEFIRTYKSMPFKEFWKEYHAFLSGTFGRLCTPLLPGNERGQIFSVFNHYEAEPIEDFVTLYTLCNGNDADQWIEDIEQEGAAYAHIGGNPLMNWDEIVREVNFAGRNIKGRYPVQSIPAGYVKNNEMLSNKIPFQHDGGGNFIAIDLDPDTKGQYGQVVEVDHEYNERVVLASSLKEYIIILYYFVKELGVIDNGEGYEGDKPLSFYIMRTEKAAD
ncbi:SMI1/KNR4 family protein [Domibacillus indicus]|uniref:SMI1/KNR4 family protein n=1 Tax=Domibacillus indicus TaxID=1437523 RepID=UPI00203E681A|nr:SMI1/KNR4 family protein [Domibacillus indicus]MCM3787184.1 SMI1/KNR4 family protein [Domibacillus indicus]